MSVWKDPLANPPAVGVQVLLKRILVQTHPFLATLTADTSNAYACGLDAWPISAAARHHALGMAFRHRITLRFDPPRKWWTKGTLGWWAETTRMFL
jgi:hypothetical protein